MNFVVYEPVVVREESVAEPPRGKLPRWLIMLLLALILAGGLIWFILSRVSP